MKLFQSHSFRCNLNKLQKNFTHIFITSLIILVPLFPAIACAEAFFAEDLLPSSDKEFDAFLDSYSGLFKDYYPDGKLKVEVNLKDGKWEGIGKRYYANGKLRTEGNYVNGNREGIHNTYHENGNVWVEKKYKNGEVKIRKVYYEDGTLEGVGNYKNGKEEGLQKEYFRNGKMKYEANYKNGKREGLEKEYLPSGELWSEYNNINGELEGLGKDYYESGALKQERHYKKGKLEGMDKFYYESGKLKQAGNYKNDKSEGLFQGYFENGKLKWEENYKNDKLEGHKRAYYESGQLLWELNYKNGNKEGLVNWYYESGELEVEVNYKNGKQAGLEKDYYESGQLRVEINFKDGRREGITKVYYENGELKQEWNYKNGKLEGLSKWYYESGNIGLERNYKNDKINGVFREYYESGVLQFRDIYKNDRKIHRTAYNEMGKLLFAQDYPYDLAEGDTPDTSKLFATKQPPRDLFKEKQRISSIATGFLFGSSGFIVTNYHVVRGAKSIAIKYQNGERTSAEVISKDSKNDIAFLKPNHLPNLKMINLSLGNSLTVRLGDKVFTLGYPIATVLGDNIKYSEGVISGLTGVGNDPKTFQISIPTQHGNSGGPLFNEKGEVIGIVSSSLDEAKTQQAMGVTPQNVNFAIKSFLVQAMLLKLPKSLVSPTDLTIVPKKSKQSNFIQQVENNIVLIEVD